MIATLLPSMYIICPCTCIHSGYGGCSVAVRELCSSLRGFRFKSLVGLCHSALHAAL
uniref:Uncharacterized protein n=1 Tax=Anguilla anguilla TaxID=7936 RepID=A0A0E9ULY1_ANGAN